MAHEEAGENKKAGRETIGWREWVALPELGIPRIKAKVDTGARTSALHACRVRDYWEAGVHRVRFQIHPLQKRTDVAVDCDAAVVDRRWVSDSGGHREKRFVICTPVALGSHFWSIELTLTDRDTMLFRMLMGRTALEDRFAIEPDTSFRMGQPARHQSII